MKIWAFISQKGGAGKSTLATQLAVYAASIDEKVLIIDLDSQGSSDAWFKVRGGNNPAVVRALAGNLAKVINGAKETKAFTRIFIDTAGRADNDCLQAMRFADLIICPTQPGMVFDIRALKDTVDLLDKAGAKDRAVGVVNRVVSQGATKAYAKAADQIEKFGIRVAGAYLGDRVAFSQATDVGKGVNEMGKAKSFTDATTEVVKLWGELNETWPVPTFIEEEAKA